MTFNNAHTPAVYCAPSRTAMMTGSAPHTTGCYYDGPFFAEQNHPELTDIPGWFRKNGYVTAGGGKLYHHMHGQIDFRSWDEYFIWNPDLKKQGWRLDSWGEGAPLPSELPYSAIAKKLVEETKARNPNARIPKVNSHMEWGPLKNEDEPKMAYTICTEWAVDFLKKDHDKPFFLGFGLYAPHKPNFAPQKYFDMYPIENIELPPVKENDIEGIAPSVLKKYKNRQNHVDGKMDLQTKKEAVQAYLASLTYADAMIGRVLDALASSKYADNTIVVVWSDNGYHMGEKELWAKHTLWERTSNVPFIWAGPGVAKGAKVNATVSLLDTYPTLIDLCKLPKQSNLDGISLQLAEPAKIADRSVTQTNDGSCSVINQNWRYIQREAGDAELYNVKLDPQETKNEIANPEYAGVVEELKKFVPANPAPAAKSLKARNLRWVAEGESYKWVESTAWKQSKSKGKKGKKK